MHKWLNMTVHPLPLTLLRISPSIFSFRAVTFLLFVFSPPFLAMYLRYGCRLTSHLPICHLSLSLFLDSVYSRLRKREGLFFFFFWWLWGILKEPVLAVETAPA